MYVGADFHKTQFLLRLLERISWRMFYSICWVREANTARSPGNQQNRVMQASNYEP